MLTPTTKLLEDYLEFEKITEEHQKLITRAQEIFAVEPLDHHSTDEWKVRYPDMLGTSYWYYCEYGRSRWYEHYPYQRGFKEYPLKATAPALVKCWDEWQDPQQFINLLNSDFTPLNLARKYGSNLAALQLLVDLWDHLTYREKLTLPLQSPYRTACLFSVTSLLSWPSHFAQEMGHLTFRQNEYGSQRVALEAAKNRTLTKHWLKALSTFSRSLETAAQLRTMMLNNLKDHQQQQVKLIPLFLRLSTTAETAEQPGTTAQNPPVPAPEMVITTSPQLDLKLYLGQPPSEIAAGEKRVHELDPPLCASVIGNPHTRRKISSVTVYN